MGDDSEWIKLPTDEKIQHKVWKARVAGYEEAAKLFPTLDEKSPEFSKYLGLVKKMTVDSNAIAQEKALDAVLAFVENAHVASKTASEVCGSIVAKCLNASRAKTKEKGLEILMMYCEIEKQDFVQEELLKGLGNKQPKIVAGCVVALRNALRAFGSKLWGLKVIVKELPRLLEDRDKIVREETKVLVVEIYRWIGAAFMPQLSNLKPVQLTELEAEFEKVKEEGKPIQTRFLRSQQDLKAKLEEQAAAREDGEDVEDEDAGEQDAAIDPYDLLDAVNILAKLPKDFYEKVEAKKWQERREVLEIVQKLTENPKLEAGDYHDLIKSLKKVVAKDTNVMLVLIAAKSLEGLAVGLRKKFTPHALGCVDTILDKFKEKKPAVVQALKAAIDAIFLTTTLEAVSESCVAALDNKNPAIKAETAGFLARCFRHATPTTLPKKLLKMFIAPLLKTINFNSPEVRENSYEALGTAMKVVGEKPMLPFLSDIDNIKQGKIKEYMEKAELVHKSKALSGPPKPAASAPPKSSTTAPPEKVVRPGAPPKKVVGGGGSAAAKAKVGAAKSGLNKKPASAASSGAKGKKPAKSQAGTESHEPILSDDAVEEKAAALLPADVISGLSSSNWKERLAAMEKFTESLKLLSKPDLPAQVCIRTLTKKPGLKETNFQVMKLKVELVAHIALNSSFTCTTASFCLLDLVEKISDVKNGGGVKEALSSIAEACGLEFISMKVIEMASSQKNPKNQAECLNWLSQAIRDFGFKVNVKPMIGFIKKSLGATNPAVRTAAIGLLAMLYMYMGDTLRMLFDGEKAALLQLIDAEFEKVKGEKPPAPTRGLSPGEDGSDEDEEGDDDEGDGAPNIADLVPRNDISTQITEALITEMADKNWKVRNEALQKVTTILNDAKFITPNIGALPEAIKLRLADSNKILVNTALSICQTIATSMGPAVKQHVRVVGPNILLACADSKPNVRANAVSCLNAWVEQTTLLPWVEAEMFSDVLAKENPFLRTELWGWLAEKLPNVKKLPQEIHLCVPLLFACLEDRNGDVRKKAQECVVPLMIHTGYDSMARKATKLKPSSKDAIMAILEKAKPQLPAKPVKAKVVKPQQAKAAAAPAAAPAVASVDTEDYGYDEPSESAATSKPAASKLKARSVLGKKAPPPTTSKKKKGEEEDTSPPMRVSDGKNGRLRDEKTLKVLKWNFTTPRAEFVDQLRTQMEVTFSKTMITQLFHADFKMHIKATETLTKCLTTSSDATIANLDMLLRWFTLRFFDTNTSVLLKNLEYLKALFAMLGDEEYQMSDYEANAFIPYLVNKVGDPKDNVRKYIRNIFSLICKVYPASKMFVFVIDGLKSKNSKQRMECLEELSQLINVHGMSVCQPTPAAALKTIGQQIGDRDNSVRSAALNACVEAYMIIGENIYKHLGRLNDKDTGMLEERIKRSTKNRPPPSSQPNPAAPPVSAQQKSSTSDEPVKPSSIASRLTAMRRAANGDAASQAAVGGAGGQSRLAAPKAVKKPGYFHLDITDSDDEEQEAEIKHKLSGLVEQDISYLYKEVQQPVIKSSHRPPSPARSMLQSSQDANSAIALVISQVASDNVTTCMQALAQIDEVLDTDRYTMMIKHIDQLLLMCTVQLRMSNTKHMDDLPEADVVKLYQCLLATLISVFNQRELAKQASCHVLKDLVSYLVTVLLDQRLAALQDSDKVIRSVNLIVVKVVCNSDPTSMMSALLRLLYDCVGKDNVSIEYCELVMKCLWRMMRNLSKISDELQVNRILIDLHRFLQEYPTSMWKSRANITPLRTIKTLVHSLTKQRGRAILYDLGNLQGQGSELEAYIRRVLESESTNAPGSSTVTATPQTNGSVDAAPLTTTLAREAVPLTTPDTTTAHVQMRTGRREDTRGKRLSKSTHDLVAEIFRKIGSKENTREGLNDLYDFKIKYPDADLDPFLKKSSPVFQNYIERGLKNIELERKERLQAVGAGGKLPVHSIATSSSTVGVGSGIGGDTTPNTATTPRTSPMDTDQSSSCSSSTSSAAAPDVAEYFEERLRNLRRRAGLDEAIITTSTGASYSTSVLGNSSSSNIPLGGDTGHVGGMIGSSAGNDLHKGAQSLASSNSSLSSGGSSNVGLLDVENRNISPNPPAAGVGVPEPANPPHANIDALRKRLERIKNEARH